MHPAFSILFFTTLAGSAQGLVVALAIVRVLAVPMPPGFLAAALVVAEVLLVAGLAASFLHLGRKMRAWRAALMWRTSWMSREVIVLPAFIVLVALWWLVTTGSAGNGNGIDTGAGAGAGSGAALLLWADLLLPLLAMAGALLLWVCTAMIYACLRFIEEWAHPLTVANFMLIGLCSGLLLACALAALAGATATLQACGSATLAATLLAWAVRAASLRRNATLRHKSTLQSATGIASPALVQKSMGMSAGAFNTREFFHGASALVLRNMRVGFQVLAFALPALLMALAIIQGTQWPWLLALIVQAPGLIAERWLFFAQARHPQNLYYQMVS